MIDIILLPTDLHMRVAPDGTEWLGGRPLHVLRGAGSGPIWSTGRIVFICRLLTMLGLWNSPSIAR